MSSHADVLRSLVINKLYSCNSVMAGAPDVILRRLLSVYKMLLSAWLLAGRLSRSVPVVVPWLDLTMYCALSARPSFSADIICHHVLAVTNSFCSHCTVVLQQQCDSAT